MSEGLVKVAGAIAVVLVLMMLGECSRIGPDAFSAQFAGSFLMSLVLGGFLFIVAPLVALAWWLNRERPENVPDWRPDRAPPTLVAEAEASAQPFIEQLTRFSSVYEPHRSAAAPNRVSGGADMEEIKFIVSDMSKAWRTLAAAKTAEQLGAARLLTGVIAATENGIYDPVRSWLKQVDSHREACLSAHRDLRSGTVSFIESAKNWLNTQLKNHSRIERSVQGIVSFDAGSPSIPPQVRGLTREILDGVRIGEVYSAWRKYTDAPREDFLKEVQKMTTAGWYIAVGALAFLLLANLASSGIGPIKVLCILAMIVGIGLVIAYRFADHKHHEGIEDALEHARLLTSRALDVLEVNGREALEKIDNEKNATLNRIAQQEQRIAQEYDARIEAALPAYKAVWDSAGILGGKLDSKSLQGWHPAEQPANFVRIGALVPPGFDIDKRLGRQRGLPPLPALLPFAPGKGIAFISAGSDTARIMKGVVNVALRTIAAVPPGKLRFLFIDPIGLGQNIAPLLALGDYVEELIGGRAWSDPAHIEQELADVTQHMENVIQKYLRDDYERIEDYNAEEGQVVEAYRFVVVCDYPENFSETAARRLVSIAQNGPRCGVYPIVVVNKAKPLPYGISLDGLLPFLNRVEDCEGYFKFDDPDYRGWPVAMDDAPEFGAVQTIVHGHGALAEEGMHVSVPFSDLLAFGGLNKATWNGPDAASAAGEITVPLGPSGSRKYQELALGRGTAHHALIVGQTGSGKSNLLHAIITTLAIKYAPDELQLYLIDFKQGVEFKLYADALLPHARVIAIQSEREFGISVLRGLDAEMARRGEIFRNDGVPGLLDWRRKTSQKMARILLLVDEFRVFFTADDQIASDATMILDRLVSQGRAFGIHAVLASQTLAGSYSLPRSVSDQMAVRIVLQCTEADSRLALADDNPEARLLSRPGEALYNDQRGLIEGNHRFQVADMGDDAAREDVVRTFLTPLTATWRGTQSRPVIFEGHRPARAEESMALVSAVSAGRWPDQNNFADVWLGEPIALRPSVSVRFLRQSAANVLIINREEGQSIALFQLALLALAAQVLPLGGAFHLVDFSSADAAWAGSLGRLAERLPHRYQVISRRELPGAFGTIHRELTRRLDADHVVSESIFLFLFGIHRMRDLRDDEGSTFGRSDDEPDLRSMFADILREGPEVGIFTMAWADSQSSAARVLDRRMIGDMGRRIVGPMSEQDLLALIDSTLAARLDKPHRMVRFDEDRPGDVETFRPYAVENSEWLMAAARRIAARTGNTQNHRRAAE